MGIKVTATRTIGYDHIDYEYARSIGMGVLNVTYSPSTPRKQFQIWWKIQYSILLTT